MSILGVKDRKAKKWRKPEFDKRSLEEEIFHGHMESLDAGTLTGWAASSLSEEPLLVNVLCEIYIEKILRKERFTRAFIFSLLSWTRSSPMRKALS